MTDKEFYRKYKVLIWVVSGGVLALIIILNVLHQPSRPLTLEELGSQIGVTSPSLDFTISIVGTAKVTYKNEGTRSFLPVQITAEKAITKEDRLFAMATTAIQLINKTKVDAIQVILVSDDIRQSKFAGTELGRLSYSVDQYGCCGHSPYENGNWEASVSSYTATEQEKLVFLKYAQLMEAAYKKGEDFIDTDSIRKTISDQFSISDETISSMLRRQSFETSSGACRVLKSQNNNIICKP